MRPVFIKTSTPGSLNVSQEFLVLFALERDLLTIKKCFQVFEIVLLYYLVSET